MAMTIAQTHNLPLFAKEHVAEPQGALVLTCNQQVTFPVDLEGDRIVMPVLPIDLDEGRRPDLAIEMPDPADERLRNEGDACGQGLEPEFRFPTRGGASVEFVALVALVAPGLYPQRRACEDPAQVVEDNPDTVFLDAVQRGIQTHDRGDPVVVVQNVHEGLVRAGTPHAIAPPVDRVVAPQHAAPHTVEQIQPGAHVRRAPQPAPLRGRATANEFDGESGLRGRGQEDLTDSGKSEATFVGRDVDGLAALESDG